VSERQGGQDANIEVLFAKFGRWLEELAGTLFHNTARVDAVDLVQETLLYACQCREQLRHVNPDRLAAWFRNALVHKIADARRRQTRSKRDQARERSLVTISQEELGTGRDPSPEEQAEHAEQTNGLAFALENLTSRQRLALHLRFVEGCTFAEIAAQLGQTRASAERLVRRALAKMQRALGSPDAN
jgi:RNA polymerase sigma factor (sigma-70 family)